MAVFLSPQEALTLVSTGKALLVDVREVDEYQALRIKEAHLRPLSLLSLMPGSLPQDLPLIFFCHSGGRTKANEKLFDQLAPGRTHIMKGGILAWKEAGQPLIAEKRPWPIMRQVQVAAGSLVLLGLALSFVAPGFLWLSAFVGAGLVFAGVTGFCGLAQVLARMPWNRFHS